MRLILFLQRLVLVLQDPEGFSTAELLGNAAMAIGALVVIWGALKILGVDIINLISQKLHNSLP
jgi:hypothetical protein